MGVILKNQTRHAADPRLLVGHETSDDAAVFNMGDGWALISTTDFFMPIVDDPGDFGRIAAVNAMSDVYAMGGTPLVAIAILGWPVDKLPASVAHDVIEGGRDACARAGIALAGGHSIDNPEPVFGLAVTGRVRVEDIKRNVGARPGDVLFLTKPLGIGILTTAQKKGVLEPAHLSLARDTMLQLNDFGTQLGEHDWVHALTDVTGFGLLGHLIEMCEPSGVSARLDYALVPRLVPEQLDGYVAAGCVPGGTQRNWQSYGEKVAPLDTQKWQILCDPQTSGGLLAAVDAAHAHEFKELAAQHGLRLAACGRCEPHGRYLVTVE